MRILGFLIKYFNKTISIIYKYLILILLLIIFIFISISIEYRIHFIDDRYGYSVLNKKLAIPYILASILPIRNIVKYDNINIILPYGYKLVDKYSSVGIIYSVISYNIFHYEMNKKFQYIDRFGSSELWIDNINNKAISVYNIRRGGIYFLSIDIKEYRK
jgi:hypothetical protein